MLEDEIDKPDSIPEPVPEPDIESESTESLLLLLTLDRLRDTEDAVLEIDAGESIGGGVKDSDCK